MLIGQRLRDIREMKNLSHDDIEKARGLSLLTFPASRTVTQFLALGTLQKVGEGSRNAACFLGVPSRILDNGN